ncbi:hypothetical protein GCM10010251_05340 [Streptomyces aurantiogriseus]|uniref:Uncharacterized protein n=1 Tax=Streptomyces aurantiogriseus TaxID=66870 RepID=A0A918EZD0_9ACTN|nr:hypothetical protein GCM10010251_05340 [Streptomyces aurantiogriseus]
MTRRFSGRRWCRPARRSGRFSRSGRSPLRPLQLFRPLLPFRPLQLFRPFRPFQPLRPFQSLSRSQAVDPRVDRPGGCEVPRRRADDATLGEVPVHGRAPAPDLARTGPRSHRTALSHGSGARAQSRRTANLWPASAGPRAGRGSAGVHGGRRFARGAALEVVSG